METVQFDTDLQGLPDLIESLVTSHGKATIAIAVLPGPNGTYHVLLTRKYKPNNS